MKTFAHTFNTPVGEMFTAVNEAGSLVRLDFIKDRDRESVIAKAAGYGAEVGFEPEKCAHVEMQLTEYFQRKRRIFDLELALEGTPFQLKVWGLLSKIPYGTTISYRELAERAANPKAVRAVGRANSANPIAIVVPCHRVIGADGSLTGYAGGLEIKRALLELEGAIP